jgi:hypothetical protein
VCSFYVSSVCWGKPSQLASHIFRKWEYIKRPSMYNANIIHNNLFINFFSVGSFVCLFVECCTIIEQKIISFIHTRMCVYTYPYHGTLSFVCGCFTWILYFEFFEVNYYCGTKPTSLLFLITGKKKYTHIYIYFNIIAFWKSVEVNFLWLN